MRFIRALSDGETFYAILEGDVVRRLASSPYAEVAPDGRTYQLSDLKLMAPVEPSKVVCIGKNYYEHALEMGDGNPPEPLLFLKPSTSVIGPGDEIEYFPVSKRIDYEAELAVVIGKTAKNVALGHAKQYIFGYTCLNDVTARDIQKSDPQWTRGKGFDTSCPIGPWIETELEPGNLRVCSRLNGEIRQDSNTSLMTHDVDKLIWYITQCMTLLPGDIVATGTPAGIGPMQPGDIVEVEVEGIGVLKNRLV